MSEEEKKIFLADIMDIEEDKIFGSVLLNDLESWDSMSVLSFITEMRVRFGIVVTTEQIRGALTIEDLFAMIPNTDE